MNFNFNDFLQQNAFNLAQGLNNMNNDDGGGFDGNPLSAFIGQQVFGGIQQAFGANGQGVGGHEGPRPPPPTAKELLAKLPRVKVTLDDLQEENNKSCCICLEDMIVGKEVIKLNCGHIFCEDCISDWLTKTSTCPICRYELKTDDAEYEKGRKVRMKKRKMRFRQDELKSYKINQLKEIMRQNSIDDKNCIDKDDLVNRIVASDKISIVEALPATEITKSRLNASSIKELNLLLLGAGLSTDDAIMKSELISRIESSPKFIILDDDKNEVELTYNADIEDGIKPAAAIPIDDNSTFSSSSINMNIENDNIISSSTESSTESSSSSSYGSEPNTANMPLKELIEISKALNVDISNCLDKEDVIKALANADVS